jgi:tetraacyldisaccharide 4'-kinase
MNRVWDDSSWTGLLWQLLTWPFALVFFCLSMLWHGLFDLKIRRAMKVPGLKVISVGGLEVGGSGKTPLVIFLAQTLSGRGERVAVLTRGYGRFSRQPLCFQHAGAPPSQEVGDEPKLIARRAPAVWIFVDRDRVAAARAAKAQGCTVAIVDDGFQHRRLHRDVDIVIYPTGTNRWVIPSGPRRETDLALSRAHVVVNAASNRAVGGHKSVQMSRRPIDVLEKEKRLGLSALRGRPVLAFAGIAKPKQFVDMLEALATVVLATEFFGDHHLFSKAELARLEAKAAALQCSLVTTEKDFERLPENFPCLRLRLEVSFDSASALKLDEVIALVDAKGQCDD